MASIMIGSIITMINCTQQFKEKISVRTLQLSICFVNPGYFGHPISLALLPSQAFIYSVELDLGGTIIQRCLGPLFLESQSDQLKGIAYGERLFRL
tara:strand:- start:461 stop:748 length:288 start_codon:yes stop_codon:yes gene_type:complete